MPLTSAICSFLYTNKSFLKLERNAQDPSNDFDPDAPVTVLEPEHKSIIPKDPFTVLKKTDLLKSKKKKDLSGFNGYYYEGQKQDEEK